MTIIYFCCYLVCLFIFIFKGINPLKNKLKIDLNKEKEKNNLEFKLNINNLLYPPIKKKPIRRLILRADLAKKNKNKNSNKPDYIDDKIKIYSKSSSRNAFSNNKINEINKNNRNETENIQNREYSDYELNELEYLEAINLDKRSLFQTYWAILKREHLIIFTFINCTDYNLLSVKLARCIFLIVGDMALNTFFFSDDSMHKLYLNYGKYDFIQQIPQITFSTIFSQLIEVFLCFLSLTDKYIYALKSTLIDGETKKISEIIKCIYIKLTIFFIFTFIFFFIYWYIITVFCGVYRNTQITFIKDSLLSFVITLLYPFVLYFISASLRICSIRDSKKRFKCIYSFSYIIPFF